MRVQNFWTYIITNAKKATLYTGHTDNIDLRMAQHLNGTYEGFSNKYGLKHLVWFEIYASREEAFRRERNIKEWKRQWKLNLIEKSNPLWLDLQTVPYWPLPDAAAFPDKYQACLKHRVDPGLRRDERR